MCHLKLAPDAGNGLACPKSNKEAALLMNLREHFYDPKSVCRGSERKRQRIAYSVVPFGQMCRSAYILLCDIGVSTLKNCVTYMTNQNYTIRPRVYATQVVLQLRLLVLTYVNWQLNLFLNLLRVLEKPVKVGRDVEIFTLSKTELFTFFRHLIQ